MSKQTASILPFLTAFLALLVPAAEAGAATSAKTPNITRVSAMRVSVAGTITIRGKNFSSRRIGNTVIFRAPDGRTAFVKPTRAGSRKLVVQVPAGVTRLFSRSGDKQLPTRFKLSVLAGRFGKFTVRRLSPVIVPSGFTSLGPLGAGSGATSATDTP